MRERLRALAALRHVLRDTMRVRGYLEVETPCLVARPSLDAHIQLFESHYRPDGAPLSRPGQRLFLRSSPEHLHKRLVAGGAGAIFELARVFRQGELGSRHNPEFTLLEWYRPEGDYRQLAGDFVAVLRAGAEALGRGPRLHFAGAELDLATEPLSLTVADAFETHAGLRLDGDTSENQLRALLAEDPGPLPWDELFHRVMMSRVEPALARSGRLVLLDRFPERLCDYARPAADAPHEGERFELYGAGLELVNAYGELRDPEVQRQRFVREQRRRELAGEPALPIDEALLDALPALPPLAGAAAGFERMAMLLLGETQIREVLAVPFDALTEAL